MKKIEKKTSIRLGSFAIYATLALIVAKVAGLISIRWLMVFTPIWLWLGCFIAMMLVLVVIGLIIGAAQELAKQKDIKSRDKDTREM